LTEDEQLSARLQELRQTGGSVLFRELTGDDWDKVYISPEPVSRDFVEKQVGASVDMEDEFTQRGHVLVFLKDNTVQRTTFVTPNLLKDGMYDSTVRLEARGYPALIDLVQ
jgi:hypothetical protein